MNWYYKLLANRPYLVLIIVAVFSIACIVVSLTFQKMPDFSDPTLGFEARGTAIGRRLTAWQNLLEETRPSGMLVANPNDINLAHNADKMRKKGNRIKHKHKKIKLKSKLKFFKDSILMTNKTTIKFDADYFLDLDNVNGSSHFGNSSSNDRPEQHWNYGKNLSFTNEEEYNEKLELKKHQWKLLREQNPPSATTDIHVKSDGFFCEAPNPEYAHFVVQRVDRNSNESLFVLNGLLAMCELEYQLTQTEPYDELCEIEVTSARCCRPWSLPNYVALLSNRTSCFDIESEDVENVKALLQECFEYYESLNLSNDCVTKKCRVPQECTQHNAVYNILHFLVDVDFIKINDTNVFVNASMIFAPIAKSTKALPLYYNLEKKSLSNDLVLIAAMDMGLKNALFDDYLRLDAWLLGLAGLFIILCIWIYTKSSIITLMIFVAIVFSLGIAYFIYAVVFKLSFFPFMNMLAVVVILGIGADDAFIFVKNWNCVIVERQKYVGGFPLTATSSTASDVSYRDTLAGLIAVTLKHAAVSMGVTSLTTAVALFSSMTNSITAIKCFGIFAGTAVMTNYVLMVTWLPASVSFVERLTCCSPKCCKQATNSIFSSVDQIGSSIEHFIISAVVNMPKLWILMLGSVGIMSTVVLFYYPRLRLPDSPDFKLFDDNHPFELYDSKFKNMFRFEKVYTDTETFKLPIRFVWGVVPVDNGNYYDPSSRGDLILDNTLNISSIESQRWLLNFCREFKRQPFYQFISGPPMLPNCFIENFIRTMDRRCLDQMSGIDRTPCCETSTFPYPPHIFEKCLPQIITILYDSPRYVFIPGIAGPKFGRDTIMLMNDSTTATEELHAVVKVLVIEYESTQPYTMAYNELEFFRHSIQTWFDKMMTTAPVGMATSWFTSDLAFLDLLETLSTDTVYAVLIAVVVSLFVLFLASLNVVISLFAIVTITFTIFTTLAVLVLLNWKLGVVESTACLTTIGLTMDFSSHYGNYYRMSPESGRQQATKYTLSRMIGPTAMAAITTGGSGAFMLLSRVQAYVQIGQFLIIVMTVSWIFATFFLMSLFQLIGPQYGFGQFNLPKFRRREQKNGTKNHVDFNNRSSTQGTASEQLLSASSSAAGEMVPSESHELSSLNSNSIVKPATALEARPLNFDRAFKNRCSSYPKDGSPTSASAITEVLPDDCDISNLEY